jgi:Mg-chelatase subunit ChlD
MRKFMKRFAAVAMSAVIGIPMALSALADTVDTEQSANKFNVVFVIDESGSMLKTDADQLRYDATDLFLGLMSQEGNCVGTVSFDDEIMYAEDIMPVSGSADKTTIAEAIKNHTTDGGDTDIGGALDKAVSMLDEKASSDYPSVIILLTDGNTDLDNNPDVLSDAEEESLEKRSEAIEEARQKGYQVYSICLNENGSADVSETKQISDATGGAFAEVNNADDLKDVFEMFYQMIYGTSDDVIYEGTVPVDAPFVVPEAGVEEANIMIQGAVTSVKFTDPSGQEYTDVETTDCGNILLEKIVNPASGEWVVSVDGDPGATVQVRLLYNYDFYVQDTSVYEDSYNQGDIVNISANLTNKDGEVLTLTKADEYSAEVVFIDENNNQTDTLSMSLVDGSFVTEYEISEQDRAYRYYIAVGLQSDQNENGAIYKKSEVRQFVSGSNTAPVSNGDVSDSVKLWPFKDNTYTLDLTTLATDAEDATLSYSVISSSFIDKATDSNGDYEISGSTLTQDNFSLRKGSYTIRCVDSGGMYCDVNVTVTTIPIGMITVLAIIIIIIIAAAVVLYGVYRALQTPFYGDCYLKQSYDGEDIKRTKARGRLPLNAFNVPLAGIDGKKSYLQAMRGEGVTLVTNKEVTVNGRKGKEHVISAGGNGTQVQLTEDGNSVVYIRFASRVSGGARRGGSRTRATAGRAGRGTDRSGAGRSTGRTTGRSTGRDSGRTTGRSTGRTTGRTTGRSTGRGTRS